MSREKSMFAIALSVAAAFLAVLPAVAGEPQSAATGSVNLTGRVSLFQIWSVCSLPRRE